MASSDDRLWPTVARCRSLFASAARKDAFDLRAWLLADIVRVKVRVLYCECDYRIGIFTKHFGCNTRASVWSREAPCRTMRPEGTVPATSVLVRLEVWMQLERIQ